jgi:hypothetical protein
MKTEDLIRSLSTDSVAREKMPWRLIGFGTLACYLALALTVSGILGVRPDFASAIATLRVQFKFLFGLVLIGSSLAALVPLMRPEATPAHALRALIPVGLLAFVGASAELLSIGSASWGARLVGQNAMFCLVAVPTLSVLPLAVLLYAGRAGASSSNGTFGLAAGLLSGGLAATAYAFHCPDDSPLFVVTWYGIAIGMVGALGAGLGQQALKW